MRFNKLVLAAPALLGLCAAQAHAQLIITPTFDSTWSGDANAAADEAAINNLITNTYEARYTNPINVTIEFSDVNTGLGSSLTGLYSSTYADYATALTADKQVVNGGDGNTAFLVDVPLAGNPVPGNSTKGVVFSSAQGRALGFNTPGVVNGTFDSQISLNIGLIQSAGYGLTSTASHEMDEVLGMLSALDGRGDIAGTATVSAIGAMDLFRYSAPGVRSFTSSGTAVSYFSDNSGVTPIVYYNQTTGADYHDWASDVDASIPGTVVAGPQVQDAFGTPGAIGLGNSEYTALNDIGYNTKAGFGSDVMPEPAECASLLVGVLGVFGLNARRKRAIKG